MSNQATGGFLLPIMGRNRFFSRLEILWPRVLIVIDPLTLAAIFQSIRLCYEILGNVQLNEFLSVECDLTM